MTTTNRVSREQEQREAEEVHESYNDNWETPSMLDTTHIPARPGFVQRWVRTTIKGEDDQNNVFKKINQGWKPRALSSAPKGQMVPRVAFNGSNVIGIHGNILMERPEEQHISHAAYNKQQTQKQMSAVKQNMFNVHKEGDGMVAPSMTNKSEVRKGRLVDSDE